MSEYRDPVARRKFEEYQKKRSRLIPTEEAEHFYAHQHQIGDFYNRGEDIHRDIRDLPSSYYFGTSEKQKRKRKALRRWKDEELYGDSETQTPYEEVIQTNPKLLEEPYRWAWGDEADEYFRRIGKEVPERPKEFTIPFEEFVNVFLNQSFEDYCKENVGYLPRDASITIRTGKGYYHTRKYYKRKALLYLRYYGLPLTQNNLSRMIRKLKRHDLIKQYL